MARKRRSGRKGSPLPLEGLAKAVASLAAVGLLAAGVGYGLGLYLTGALSPDVASSPQPGSIVADIPPDDGIIEPDPDKDLVADPGPDSDTEPKDEPPTEPEAEPVTAPATRQISVAPVALYVVQLGAFGAADNAEQMVKELQASDVAAAAIHIDGHRVWSGMFTDRDSARRLSEDMQSLGHEAFVAERRVGSDVLLRDDSSETTAVLEDAVARLPGYVWETAALWSSGGTDTGGSFAPPAETPLMDRLRESARALDRIPESADSRAVKSTYNRLILLAGQGSSSSVQPSDVTMSEAARLLAEAEQMFRELAAPSDN